MCSHLFKDYVNKMCKCSFTPMHLLNAFVMVT